MPEFELLHYSEEAAPEDTPWEPRREASTLGALNDAAIAAAAALGAAVSADIQMGGVPADKARLARFSSSTPPFWHRLPNLGVFNDVASAAAAALGAAVVADVKAGGVPTDKARSRWPRVLDSCAFLAPPLVSPRLLEVRQLQTSAAPPQGRPACVQKILCV